MTKLGENKIGSTIYKVIRTQSNDYALACSEGLVFASFDNRTKKFVKSPDFLVSEHVITSIHEVANNKFVVGCWGVAWVGYVDR